MMQPIAMFASWVMQDETASPCLMDYMGFVAICLIPLAVIGAAWRFQAVNQRQSQPAPTTIARSATATIRVMIQPVSSADMSNMPGMLVTDLQKVPWRNWVPRRNKRCTANALEVSQLIGCRSEEATMNDTGSPFCPDHRASRHKGNIAHRRPRLYCKKRRITE